MSTRHRSTSLKIVASVVFLLNLRVCLKPRRHILHTVIRRTSHETIVWNFSLVLKGPALGFWEDHVQSDPDISQVGDVFNRLEKQFDSPAHQRQIEALALSMTIEDIRKQNSCSRVAALGTLYHEVSRLNDQFPKEKRGETFRIRGLGDYTLMIIVHRYTWSRNAEEDVMQGKINIKTCTWSFLLPL